ncbi:MAG: hypothetical protein HC889_18805 [Synechococcaceae cyanobacterium SM1_2_3]|nr:hypothetical protein [Synechococcaceae cyanobacterium SM1_2_3]
MAFAVTTGKNHARRIAAWTAETTAGSAAIARYAPLVSLSVASVQVGGTPGGGTLVLQGSNDGVTYDTLKDLQGNDLSFTAAGYAEFSSGAAFIKPLPSGGTADSWNITVTHWAA